MDLELLKSGSPVDTKKELLSIKDKKEKERQVCRWACVFGFDELLPEVPPKPPYILSLRRQQEQKLRDGEELADDPEFWARSGVKAFLDEKWRINSKNKSNFEWLLHIYTNLDVEKDYDLLKDVHNRLKIYVQYFNDEKNREPVSNSFAFDYLKELTNVLAKKQNK